MIEDMFTGELREPSHELRSPYSQKIKTMHRVHGKTEGRKCKECVQFLRAKHGANTYFKCQHYGVTRSDATDWRANWTACGVFEEKDDGDES